MISISTQKVKGRAESASEEKENRGKRMDAAGEKQGSLKFLIVYTKTLLNLTQICYNGSKGAVLYRRARANAKRKRDHP